MVDPRFHGTANPVYSDVDYNICLFAAVLAEGKCGAAVSVVSISEIRTKVKH
jgi:hypothetical protein